jgi:hypothetical protein
VVYWIRKNKTCKPSKGKPSKGEPSKGVSVDWKSYKWVICLCNFINPETANAESLPKHPWNRLFLKMSAERGLFRAMALISLWSILSPHIGVPTPTNLPFQIQWKTLYGYWGFGLAALFWLLSKVCGAPKLPSADSPSI